MFNEENMRVSSQPMARGFMTQVFAWMFAGLGLSAATSYFFSLEVNPALFQLAQRSVFLLLIAQIGIVFYYSFSWKSLSFQMSGLLFITYSLLTGVIFLPLLYIYTTASLLQVLAVTAVTFGVMAVYGWVTNFDLSQLHSLLFMALVGVVVSMLANTFFFQSDSVSLVISFIGVLLFTVLIAYHVQQLKHISHMHVESSEMRAKLALMGALQLYLAVINLFLFLLRILGRRR